MNRRPEQRLKDLEFSVKVLTEILRDENLLDDERINEKSRELKKEALEEDLNSESKRAETEWNPKTASETVEYSDGSVEKSGPQFQD